MKKWIPLILGILLLAATGMASAVVLQNDGIAFKDYDLNDDGQFTSEDVQYEAMACYDSNHNGIIDGLELLQAIQDWRDGKISGDALLIIIDLWRNEIYIPWWIDGNDSQTTPPNVTKYDINLDTIANATDYNITYIAYNAFARYSPTCAIDFETTVLYLNNTVFIFEYPKNYMSFAVNWYLGYTPIIHHRWSAAGCEDLPHPTPYFYVCSDFAFDAYWVANKQFLHANNQINSSAVVLLGFATVLNDLTHHAYSAILIGDNPLDLNNWLVFEPQGGKPYTWDDINSSAKLKEKYDPNGTKLYFEYFDINGQKYTLCIHPTWGGNNAKVMLYPYHKSEIIAQTYRINDYRCGVELDHVAGVHI